MTDETLETGYLTIPVHLEYNPEDSRAEASKAAERDGARLTGDPEVLSVKDIRWSPGYEPLADRDDMKVIRWTMVRERRTDG